MKKIVVVLLLLDIVYSTSAFAEELVIHLKSGSSVVIKYTGAIHGVSFNGSTDAIEGMNIQGSTGDTTGQMNQPQTQKKASDQPQAQVEKSRDNNDGKKSGSGLRLRWAEPKRED